MNKKTKGALGEEKAASFLKKKGYNILKRNFRIREGEVDIIAERDEELVFVEVKSWDALSFESLEYAISKEKQRRIIEVSKHFLALNPEFEGSNLRFDVLFFTCGFQKMKHLKNAFNGV